MNVCQEGIGDEEKNDGICDSVGGKTSSSEIKTRRFIYLLLSTIIGFQRSPKVNKNRDKDLLHVKFDDDGKG